ncbi:MAG: hypothetical protein KKE20_06370 [Nanoarchaeota archaeon]|nr:hypothetical protein [Nanoarchaeota archaeon]
MLLLQCPRCKKQMKYASRTLILGGKRKECVYCGFSFKVKDNILKKIEA